jgi:hypothetical protein
MYWAQLRPSSYHRNYSVLASVATDEEISEFQLEVQAQLSEFFKKRKIKDKSSSQTKSKSDRTNMCISMLTALIGTKRDKVTQYKTTIVHLNKQ